MTVRTYAGTCQCGRVRYEAQIDLSAPEVERQLRIENRSALIKSSAFRLVSGGEHLEDTQMGMLFGHNRACRHCGIRPFGKGRLQRFGGDFYTINLATLDNLSSSAP
jgi:hypothetical protein